MVYSPVGILPPDQYLALVVQATRGCAFNTCTFCDLYRDGYRVKSAAERAKTAVILSGDLPSPMNPPSGCVFRTRCPLAVVECAAAAPALILGVPLFDMLFVMYVRFRRGLPVMLGSPDHVALRLRKWRLSTRQTPAVASAAVTIQPSARYAVPTRKPPSCVPLVLPRSSMATCRVRISRRCAAATPT